MVISYDEYIKKKKKNGTTNKSSVISYDDFKKTYKEKEEDLVPIKSSKKKEEKRTWFSSGAFEDGYDLGDITKTILGTTADIGVNVVKGAANVGEGIGDLISYGVAGISDKLGFDDYAELTRKEASRNMVEDWFEGVDRNVDKYSVIGEKGDSIPQGIGNVLTMIGTGGLASGLGKAGSVMSKIAPTLATTGLSLTSGTGSGIGEAYQGGANDEEALKYGLISGVADAGTELLFGGLGKSINAVGLSKGLSSADDMLAQKVGSMFKNQLAKNLSEYTIKAGAEGLEEVAAGVIQGIGKYVTYQTKEDGFDLGKILSDENLLEQFIVGAVTSGIVQTPGLVKATQGGRDFVTNYTQNEQKVIDKEVENRIVEAQKEGKILNNKEITKIQEEVKQQLEKGYISLDTIESTLGGETYNKYKSLTDKKKSLESEINKLENKKLTETTVKDNERLQDLRKQLSELDTDSVKSQLSTEVDNLTQKDAYLRTSYNERANKGVNFQADLTKYDEKQQKVVKKAIDSGILNNTNKTHDFVDMIAKISADKGVDFDFTNNENLKNSGFAVEGKSVNGFVKNGSITLNIESSKALNSVVGHEITHVLEGTELYDVLKDSIKEYATMKGEYDTRLAEVKNIYKNVKNADVEGELTADLVGDYIFSDPDFVKTLSTKQPNVFQKIYNEIKYLYKIATAGSTEAKQLEKVKKAFEDAYRGKGQVSEQTSDTQYSLFDRFKKSKDPVKEDIKYLKTLDENNDYFYNRGKIGELEEVYNGTRVSNIDEGNRDIEGSSDRSSETSSRRELSRYDRLSESESNNNVGSHNSYEIDRNIGKAKITEQAIREINQENKINNTKSYLTTMSPNDFLKLTTNSNVLISIEEQMMYEGRSLLNVEDFTKAEPLMLDFDVATGKVTTHEGRHRMIALRNVGIDKVEIILNPINGDIKENQLILNSQYSNRKVKINSFKDIAKITDTNKVSFSMQEDIKTTDNKGRKLSKEQQSFFKDSKIRDENGNLKVVYHGTRADFNVFESERAGQNYENGWSQSGKGFYFTDNQTEAQEFGDYSLGKSDTQVKEVYLNIANPFDTSIEDATLLSEIGKEYGVDPQFTQRGDFLLRWFRNNGIDGTEVLKKHGYDGIVDYGHYVAFESNQIKNIDNAKPTSDPDIRYSLSETPTTDNQGRQLTKEQQVFFKDSKVRDEEGRLLEVYHGSPNEFTIFDKGKIKTGATMYASSGDGFYFTDSEAKADKYSKGGIKYLTYLNITNPFVVENKISNEAADLLYKFSQQVIENHPEAIQKGIGAYELFDRNDIGLRSGTAILSNVVSEYGNEFTDFLKENGYNGIKSSVTDYDNVGEQYNYVAFESNQIKNVDNTNPTDDPDIRYALSEATDNEGNKVNMGIQKWAENSKVRDENGNLKVLYHGTATGEFTVFDKSKANPEGDWGAGFYLTDNAYDVETNYEDGGADFDNKIERLAERIESEEEISYEEAKEKAREQLYKGSYKITSYVNVEKPAIVGKTYLFSPEDYYDNYNMEDFNSEEGYYEAIDQLIADDIDSAIWEIENEYDFWNGTDEIRNVMWEAYAEGGMEIQQFKERLNELYLEAEQGLVANDVARIIIESLGYDGVVDPTVSTKWNMSMDSDTTHYIVFKPNQIKNITNENPTDNPDINMSLSNQNDVAPVKNPKLTYGEDVKLQESLLPTTQEVETNSLVEADSNTDIAPVKDELDLTDESAIKLEAKQQRAYKKLGSKEDYMSNRAYELYDEVKNLKKGTKASYELSRVLDVAFAHIEEHTQGKTSEQAKEIKNAIWKRVKTSLLNVKAKPLDVVNPNSKIEVAIRENLNREYNSKKKEIDKMKEEDLVTKTKKELRKGLLIDKNDFFIKALDNAKNRSMALMNNTDTIRNTELVFGRENAKVINELIFQKEIDNEADSIAWQNKERAEIKDLGIKARSKESAAVQKYGEKQYVEDNGKVVEYTDNDLANEFTDIETQNRIKNAAKVIRQKYDNYIDVANGVLTKLGFEPIKKRNDYMRHFQELNDVFSRWGIPFNAQNMQEHTLPTDINGITEFWSPQKNYFANMQPRKGMKTNLDAITGIDGYIGGIANLIYHTEDIQRGRAFEELIRETYGEDKGWDNLENLPEELQQARAEKIQDNHLSNYAAWVHEWTNNIAGKKNKIDRSVESMFGRKAFTVLDEVRKQVGSNMIGLNLSSSLTNLIAPVQAMAKTNKLAVAKGTADTIKNMFVKDNFMDKNKFLTARMGTDMLSKTTWGKIQDAGFVFMKGMDWFSSNQIVRSKYYELRAKGMSEADAHAEAGKFAARILGDRTKGANAQLYNSKLVGLVTQFQLEVNNQLYSMFYDTYHESKENAKGNAMQMAAGMTFTLGQLFAFTHLFGQTFEAIAGYNPTFDIVEMLKTALGWDDEEDEETTTSERLKKSADMLVDALPYVNILTGGGRIPVASGIPNLVGVATGGKDQYSNELTLEDELKKLLYLIPPTGGNQFKKTTQGLGMFDEDLPVSGSYTDSGNLRFPVEDTIQNRIQAGIFGQWANKNAGDYFDNERQPLKEKQIQEYADLDIPIADYWEYREGLKEQKTIQEKFDYINSLDVTDEQKNIMINNAITRKDAIDMSGYDNFGSYEEFDYATKNPDKYKVIEQIDTFDNYNSYKDDIASIKKQYSTENGYSTEERKYVVQEYINSLSLSVPQKLMLQKMAGGYSIRAYEDYMFEYINSLEMTAEEKQELHKQLFD